MNLLISFVRKKLSNAVRKSMKIPRHCFSTLIISNSNFARTKYLIIFNIVQELLFDDLFKIFNKT